MIEIDWEMVKMNLPRLDTQTLGEIEKIVRVVLEARREEINEKRIANE